MVHLIKTMNDRLRKEFLIELFTRILYVLMLLIFKERSYKELLKWQLFHKLAIIIRSKYTLIFTIRLNTIEVLKSVLSLNYFFACSILAECFTSFKWFDINILLNFIYKLMFVNQYSFFYKLTYKIKSLKYHCFSFSDAS